LKSRVSESGQITIDRDIRKKLGVEPGMIAYQRVVAGRRVPPVPDDMLEELVQEAIAAELDRKDSEIA
jgi:bifunctional DNA-binding transcriptional regulator/antitoxin component of YhaV-PrlF toxin-antitoxin module